MVDTGVNSQSSSAKNYKNTTLDRLIFTIYLVVNP